MKTLLACVALVLAMQMGTLNAASAQGIVKGQYGDWQVWCDTPPGASFEQCGTTQTSTDIDQPTIGVQVTILKIPDQQKPVLRVRAPLGVLIPFRLGLTVDDTNLGVVDFWKCLPNGCFADVPLEDQLLAMLSSGKLAYFKIFMTPEEGIGIPFSLVGFKEAMAALP